MFLNLGRRIGMGEGGLERIVVLSDCHFGEEKAMLHHGDVVEKLLSELQGLGEIDKLVLLGDVWDMWRTDLALAVGEGAVFFQAIADWKGTREIILVPGNHDNHLWTYSEERRRRAGLGWDECVESAIVLREGSVAGRKKFDGEGLILKIAYPLLALTVRGKTVLLMHGHHLDFFSRSFWWAKTAWLARWILGSSRGIAISDVDRMNKPFFELLTSTAQAPELVSKVYRFYGLLRFLARLLRFGTKAGASPRRYTSVGENSGEAADLLGRLLPGYIPDLFVFGHTHRAGFFRISVGSRPVLMANTGCWLEGSGEETAGTYLVVDDAVRLRVMDDFEIAMSI